MRIIDRVGDGGFDLIEPTLQQHPNAHLGNVHRKSLIAAVRTNLNCAFASLRATWTRVSRATPIPGHVHVDKEVLMLSGVETDEAPVREAFARPVTVVGCLSGRGDFIRAVKSRGYCFRPAEIVDE